MDLPQLRDFIVAHFNDNEVRDLCFDLGIDYESLPGEGKAAKARELVAYCQRRNRLAELEAACLRLRPDVFNAPVPPAPADRPSASSAVNQSGGVTINAQTVNITGDVTGRDKKIEEGGSGAASTPSSPPPPPTNPQAAPPQAQGEFQYDVFISYSHKDETWVIDTLLPRLERAGLRVVVSGEFGDPGVARVVNIERGIQQAKRTVVVLSSNYLADSMADFENVLAQTLGIQEGSYRLLPVKMTPVDDTKLPLRIKMLTLLDLSHPHRAEHEFERLVQALVGPLPH
jgi:hypothetical protein